MLSKKLMGVLAVMLNTNADELAKQISDEKESELTLPEGRFLTTKDEETLLDNHGKKKYDEGRGKGDKELVEAAKLEHEIEFEGHSMADFVSTLKANVLADAKVEPNQKIEELQGSISTLQQTIIDKDKAFEALEGSVSLKETKYKVASLIPTLSEAVGLTKEEASGLFFMGHEVKDGAIFKNGEKMKDTLQNDISLETAVKDFVASKGWDKAPSGRGGGAGGGGGAGSGKPKNMEEYEEYLAENDIKAGSVQANALLADMVEDES